MTPPEPPYDLPRLKEMTKSLRDLLEGAAQGIDQPEQRRELGQVSESFQRILQDFETEYSKLDAEVDAKLAEAQKKMTEAQATMREAEEKAKVAALAEPDWSLGPKLRDELVARRVVAPPPPAIDPSGSLAPWALSPEPIPVTPPQVHAPAARAPQPFAQSVASWLVDSPPVPAPHSPSSSPPASASGHGSIVSWMFSGSPSPVEERSEDQEAWKQATKQWLTKPRRPDAKE